MQVQKFGHWLGQFLMYFEKSNLYIWNITGFLTDENQMTKHVLLLFAASDAINLVNIWRHKYDAFAWIHCFGEIASNFIRRIRNYNYD